MSKDQELVELEKELSLYTRKLWWCLLTFSFCTLAFVGSGRSANTFLLAFPWAISLLAVPKLAMDRIDVTFQIKRVESSKSYTLTDDYPPMP